MLEEPEPVPLLTEELLADNFLLIFSPRDISSLDKIPVIELDLEPILFLLEVEPVGLLVVESRALETFKGIESDFKNFSDLLRDLECALSRRVGRSDEDSGCLVEAKNGSDMIITTPT